MDISAQSISSSLAPRDPRISAGLPTGQSEFAAVLSRLEHRPDAGARDSKTKAREAAEQFVAIALVQPVLKQLRESSMAAEPFKATSAERSFRAMHDAVLAQRIVKSSSWGLVDQVARRMHRDGVPTGAP